VSQAEVSSEVFSVAINPASSLGIFALSFFSMSDPNSLPKQSSHGTQTTPMSVLEEKNRAKGSIEIGRINRDSLQDLLIKDAKGKTINDLNFSQAITSLENQLTTDTDLKSLINQYLYRRDGFYQDTKDREHLLYLPISYILNSLSTSSAGILGVKEIILRCIPHHTNPPQFITDLVKYPNAGKPDLLIIASRQGELADTLSSQKNIIKEAGLTKLPTFHSVSGLNRKHWANVLSFVEVKSDTVKMDQKRTQEYPYCFDFWEHQPGLFRILYLTASSTHYDIKRLDPVCALESRSPWLSDAIGNDTTPENQSAILSLHNLCLYIMSLYFEQKDERFQVRGQEDNLRFLPNNKAEYKLSSIFRQPYSRRKTHVFIGEKLQGNTRDPALIAVKLAWKDIKSKRNETNTIKRIHSDPNSVLPGIVKLHEPFLQSDGIRTNIPNEVTSIPGEKAIGMISVRERVVVVMSTVGFPLNSCESLLKIFMVLFDVNECEYMLLHFQIFEFILL
jgi:hypothetical protein